MKLRHAHPVMILEYLWRFMYLLIIPLVRGVGLALSSGLSGWLRGVWIDLLVLAVIITLAVAKWWCLTFCGSPCGVTVCGGLFWRSKIYISQAKIDTLAVTCPYYLKPLRAVRLRADTKAGRFNKADIKITLFKADAEEIFAGREIFYKVNENKVAEYKPHGAYIVALAAILSNSFAGVLFFATFISQSGTLLGEEFEARVVGTFQSFTKLMAFGVPPAAATIAYLMLFGWVFTFLLNLFRLKNFCATRSSGLLSISGGLFTNRRYSIAVREINYADIRQGVLTKLLGLYSVFVQAVGYGKAKDDVSAIIPALKITELTRTVGLLLPEFKLTRRQAKPNFGALLRFITDALWAAVLLPVATFMLMRFLPTWREFIQFVGFMGCLPAYLFLAVRIIDFTSSGIGRQGDIYTLRYSSGFKLHTVIMPRSRVATITLRQSVFQKMDNKCDVLIYSLSEKRRKHHVRNIDKTMAIKILDLQAKEN